MKLSMTALINFNINKKEIIDNHISLHNNPGYRSLINQKRLLSKLLVSSHNARNWKSYQIEYQRSILLAILNFKNLKFRQNYSKWIYTHYSNSLNSHKVVQQNELRILFKWAKAFNQHHKHLKIIKILPRIDNNHLYTYLLLIPFSIKDKLSFDLKAALINEYHTNYYDQALYKFEIDAGNILANIMQRVFCQCIPNSNFHFINQISKILVLKLKPIKHRNVIKSVNDDKISQQFKSVSIKTKSSNEASLLEFTSESVSLLPAPSSATGHLSLNVLMESSNSVSAVSLAPSSFTSKSNSTRSMASLTSENEDLIKYTRNYSSKKFNSKSVSSSSLSYINFQSFMASKQTSAKPKSSNGAVNKQKKKDQLNKSASVLNNLRKNKGYITLIIIISFIIIALLIIVFPVLRF